MQSAPKHIKYLAALSRRNKTILQMFLDGVLLILSLISAMVVRLEHFEFLNNIGFWTVAVVSTGSGLVIFNILGLYRTIIRYITGKILLTVGKGTFGAGVTVYISSLMFNVSIPRSVPVIFIIFAFLLVGGTRFMARAFFRNPSHQNKLPVIVYGAGEAGRQLINSLYHGREYLPVALIDDDPNLSNMTLSGLRVFTPSSISRLVEETGAKLILLAVPSISRTRRREIVSRLDYLELEIKTIPGMSEIINGKAKISELRTVSPEDLLGREPVPPDRELMGKHIYGRVVMVTGAGGSIGSELCRQILKQEPAAILLYELSELALYTIDMELNESAKSGNLNVLIVPLLGCVRQRQRVEEVIRTFKVTTIYHAAAYKHVPLVEENIIEGINNNVSGTLVLTTAAKKYGVHNFILISTDKAVRPTNIMGASKRISELVCQAYAQEKSSTIFSMVRFGNVLGSSGSVIPRFHAQIESGGPVTVTHKDITRYFMTIPEASQLVIQAGAMAKGGDVFVLDMGDPVRIIDLALGMIRRHGLRPYFVDNLDQNFPEQGDIPVCVTGLRKGEKLYEELLIGNNPLPTQHSRIMTANEISVPVNDLMPALEQLFLACNRMELPSVIDIIRNLPLGYAPTSDSISDLLWKERCRIDFQTEDASTE